MNYEWPELTPEQEMERVNFNRAVSYSLMSIGALLVAMAVTQWICETL